MAGNKSGGVKAAKTNRAKHGEDFYRVIGPKHHASWVRNGKKPRGFSTMTPEQHSAASKKGGSVGRRTSQQTETASTENYQHQAWYKRLLRR